MKDPNTLEALRALAEHDRAREAPPEVEGRLRVKFRRDCALRAWRRRAVWSGAAAAVAIVGLVLDTPKRTGNPVPAGAPDRAAVTVNSTVPHGDSMVKSTVIHGGTQKPSKTNRGVELALPIQRVASVAPAIQPPTTPQRSEVESVTDFFPLIDAAPPFERGEILRVNLPASVMRTVGLPVREERLGDRVEADVVVGEEGLPRAIRFVRTNMQ